MPAAQPSLPKVGHNLILRELLAEDLPSLYTIESDLRVKCYLRGPVTKRRDAWIQGMERCLPRSGIIAILTKDTRQFAGRAALTPTPSPSEREIQVIISQHYWGRRFGREVSHILIEAAFDELGADQVVAVAHPENLASLNLLASFGFESDGTIQDGTWQNGHRRFTLSLANFLKSPGASLTE